MNTLNETEVLKQCIALYVTCERNSKFKGRKEYYNAFGNRMYTYLANVYKVKYDNKIENKQYQDMMKKFFTETVNEQQLSKKACFQFGEYFYQKFLAEIKRQRVTVQGTKYSKNTKEFAYAR